jgi:hypothetical protein
MSVLFAPKREVLEGCLASQHFVPIDGVGDLPDLCGSPPGSIDPADQPPHAGSSDIAYGNAVFFHPLQNADMGKA